MINFLLIFIFIFIFKESRTQTGPHALDYIVRVVEYNMNVNGETAVDRLAVRVQDYNRLIREHAPYGLVPDIIIFPEGTLTEITTPVTIPNPNQAITMCENANFLNHPLKMISCAARDFFRYVVINVIMIQVSDDDYDDDDDHDNSGDGQNITRLYNTNVVFNRLGQVISVYRKFNLFNEEPGIVAPLKPDNGIFTTSFGVRFGHIISRDLIMEQPIQTMLKKNVQNFIMTTRWHSSLPFLLGVQIQKNWSFARNVNLLAASSNNPSVGETGSGIYSGRQGELKSVMSENIGTTTLISHISRIPGTNPNFTNQIHPIWVPNITFSRDNLKYFGIHPLSPISFAKNIVTSKFCDYDFCCTFQYQLIDDGAVPNTVTYSYVAVIFNGKRDGLEFSAGARITVCAIIACTDNQNRDTCGKTFDHGLVINNRFHFNSLTINGTFGAIPNASTMPTTLRPNLQPLDYNYVQYIESPIRYNSNDESIQDVSINLNLPNEHLLTFGIYSRDFTSSIATGLPPIMDILLFISLYWCYYI